jgi:hypothetical protein
MTEAEWLACGDPGTMDLFLSDRGEVSERKFRLFGCACVRDVWDDLPHDALRRAVEVCERFADGLATAEELRAAREAADGTYEGNGDVVADHSAIAITDLCHGVPSFPMGEGSSAGISAVAAEARSDRGITWYVAREQAKQLHCRLLRDIFGNPFRPVAFSPVWRTDTAIALARQMYESRDFGAMPILADALQDAGCDNPDILDHCRNPGEHVRGCWVVDLVLYKE